jgi:hypothetical protein
MMRAFADVEIKVCTMPTARENNVPSLMNNAMAPNGFDPSQDRLQPASDLRVVYVISFSLLCNSLQIS